MPILSLINKLPFGSPAEKGFFLYKAVPEGILRSLEESNFRKTISYAYERSPFYRRKFNEHGIDPRRVKRPEDLGDFFTTAEDIRKNVQDFVSMRPDTAYETTGTTSKRSKRVYFSRNEVREAGWAGSVGLYGIGIRSDDRIASAFDYSFWVSGPVLQASCEALGCFHVEAGRIHPEEFYERLKDYGLTVIVGDPSWILALTEVAEKKGPWPLKLLIGGGENVTEKMRRYVEGVWKADFILGYGQTEAFGAIGMESLEKVGYHLNTFHNFFEIVDQNKEGYGELVYTTLNRRVMPLIRYRSGDVTRWIKEKSTVGLPGQRIEKLKGRVNEWTATAMGNLAPWMFEPVFNAIPGVGPDWQIVIDKADNKDLITLHVESPSGELSESVLKDQVFSQMKKELSDGWKNFEMGFLKVDFKIHPKGSLRSGRKLIRLVDQRQF